MSETGNSCAVNDGVATLRSSIPEPGHRTAFVPSSAQLPSRCNSRPQPTLSPKSRHACRLPPFSSSPFGTRTTPGALSPTLRPACRHLLPPFQSRPLHRSGSAPRCASHDEHLPPKSSPTSTSDSQPQVAPRMSTPPPSAPTGPIRATQPQVAPRITNTSRPGVPTVHGVHSPSLQPHVAPRISRPSSPGSTDCRCSTPIRTRFVTVDRRSAPLRFSSERETT